MGQFSRARRGELDPTVLGLPAPEHGTRRVPGLRRVEVATHAAISRDYYNRIEQGRLAPSTPVLDALANTPALTPLQRTYLEGLARRADPRTTTVQPQRILPVSAEQDSDNRHFRTTPPDGAGVFETERFSTPQRRDGPLGGRED
ncbi:helix-turn-helix transcriptional regulator [Nocardia sp. NPDC047648]|uniref:helix-turn-helix domain-containing protein n=1 Tax=Nocardia sp. NPDC047648 TaxID=3155625 RepID=UPI0033DCBAD9